MLGLSIGIEEVSVIRSEVKSEEEKLRSMILKVTNNENHINAIINSGVEIKDIIKYISGSTYCDAIFINDKIQSSLMETGLNEKESGRLIVNLIRANN